MRTSTILAQPETILPYLVGGTIDCPVFSKGEGDKDVDAVHKHR